MEELTALINKRSNIKGRLTRITNAARNFQEGNNVYQLKTRIPYMESLLTEFNDTQLRIESLDPTAAEKGDQELFETQYFDTYSEIRSTLERCAQSVILGARDNRQSNNPDPSFNVRLPSLSLPTFSGSFTDWNSFYDSFDSLINQNNKLNNCERFHYLKSCLTDEPLHAIESLPVSDANYISAWEILRKRYENKRLIVQEHVLAIINAPVLHKSSHSGMRQLLDKLTSNLEALRVLKLPVESWDALVVPIMSEKLDNATKCEWQKVIDTEVPKLCDFVKFLEKRLEILASLETVTKHNSTTKGFFNANKQNYQTRASPRQVSYLTTNKSTCLQCKKSSHNIYQCTQFLRLSVAERIRTAEKYKLCRNCLRDNHSTSDCRSNKACVECKQKHNSLLHQGANAATITSSASNLDETPPVTALNCSNYNVISNTTLLSTALIYIKDYRGNFKEGRCVLDAGSQSCFIADPMCKRLGLPRQRVNVPVIGINQDSYSAVTESVRITIKSRINSFEASVISLVLPKITQNIPLESFSVSHVELPENIQLADPQFNQSRQIDLLIGAELFWALLCDGRLQTRPSQPFLQETKLGWVIGGAINLPERLNTTYCNLSLNSRRNSINTLEDGLKKFWEIEEGPAVKRLSLEEKRCEEQFKDTLRRTAGGRFIVKLPFKDKEISLGKSYEIALQQFNSLEKRLNKNPKLKEGYSNFIKEYLDLKHMELVPKNEINKISCYLPHHVVFKDAGTLKKLRVVFNASSRTSNNLSLNDNLMCGPVLQEDLFAILTRFRTFQYVLTGDITKMYRQIIVDPSQTNYQRILWRNKPQENIQSYRLLTLTYGTKPASFIATRCLQELASENSKRFPLSSLIIKRDFYMDDLLTGGNSIQEVINLRKEITTILAGGGFELRKFSSNHPDVLPNKGAQYNNKSINLDRHDETKILGLIWNCTTDVLKYEVKLDALPEKVTKRLILAIIARIFDPLGLIGPITMKAKIILQELWSLKLDWDETLPTKIYKPWKQFLNELPYLNEFLIERKVISVFPVVAIELHGFCDASQAGYGAAIYLRSTDVNNKHSAQLLCAKSRVAPLKTISIPRLELCAALLLAKLTNTINQTLGIHINKSYLWTDSKIVLAWLLMCPSTLNTFVANRVTEIQTLTSVKDWCHVNSEDNPADVISRGQFPRDLLKSHIWFHGPKWLSQDNHKMPQLNVDLTNVEISEQRKIALVVNEYFNNELPLLTKYSKFYKLQRVMAYCLRFIKNCQADKTRRFTGFLSIQELHAATRTIIKMIQRREFSAEFRLLKKGNDVGKQSSLITLNPFIDEHDLIRVGGRLKNAPVSVDKKYPLILPKKHHVTKLIIIQEHENQLHAGNQATLASLRQKYWIINARDIIRQILYRCMRCLRANPRPTEQKMGDLPKDRLVLTRPFVNTGIDYAGPILIKDGRGRGKRNIKAYIALFICLATKAVHLELVGDLSTESFLNALKRFMARRGCVSNMFSDNATNFIGAKHELEELSNLLKNTVFQNKLHASLAPKSITWKFIPPRSPNMGGLWEINIRAVKRHLRRILGDTFLTYEEMYTLLTRIEACLNSRPIMPLSSDPNDLVALTPGHFLIGETLTTPVEIDLLKEKVNRLTRWQHVEKIQQHFWRRWQRDYLLQLQQRKKWMQENQHPLRVGDLVIISEDNLPPQQWLLGRISELHPGTDGIVRIVSIKTVRGTILKRSIRRVCPLLNE